MSAIVSYVPVESGPPVRGAEDGNGAPRASLVPWLRWYVESQTDDTDAVDALLDEIVRRMQFGHFARGADDVRWAFAIADRVLTSCNPRLQRR